MEVCSGVLEESQGGVGEDAGDCDGQWGSHNGCQESRNSEEFIGSEVLQSENLILCEPNQLRAHNKQEAQNDLLTKNQPLFT